MKSPETRKGDRFLFPPWTNKLGPLSALLVVGGLVYVVVVVTLVFGPETSAIGYTPEQPVEYSHALHVGELGLDCRYCHSTVERTASAAVPAAATCMNCHQYIKRDSLLLAPVVESFETGNPIAWNRVHDLPDFVFFNHAAHLNAGVSCISCHGRVDRMEVVSQEERLTMGWCLDCHREPDVHIRPEEFVTDLAWVADGDPLELGRRLREERGIAPSTDCSTCHR
jgi:menaquinone reductase, multiheme cytochrome c subunit